MSLLNKKAVKTLAMDSVAMHRPHLKDKLTRVSGFFLERAEAQLRQWVRVQIENAPSVGKTLR